MPHQRIGKLGICFRCGRSPSRRVRCPASRGPQGSGPPDAETRASPASGRPRTGRPGRAAGEGARPGGGRRLGPGRVAAPAARPHRRLRPLPARPAGVWAGGGDCLRARTCESRHSGGSSPWRPGSRESPGPGRCDPPDSSPCVHQGTRDLASIRPRQQVLAGWSLLSGTQFGPDGLAVLGDLDAPVGGERVDQAQATP
jgi:hypothetical protein